MSRRNLLLVVFLVGVEVFVVSRRRGTVFGMDTIVRCRRGHLFTTYWIPGVSFKGLKFGWWRFQFCPVGRHWTLVTPAEESELTGDEKRLAAEHHDIRIP